MLPAATPRHASTVLPGQRERSTVVPLEPLGLYLHIPFCVSVCGYCNFTREPLVDDALARYVNALEREIDVSAWRSREQRPGSPGALPVEADTVYLGGGTPSLLKPADVRRLLEMCRRRFDFAPDAEITIEANPETLTPGRLAGFREAGVTRLSVGVQSFRDAELRLLGRAHDAERARRAFREARSAGFDNISVDLIMGLPGQCPAEWAESVAALEELSPEHASLYLLELYSDSPLWRQLSSGCGTPDGACPDQGHVGDHDQDQDAEEMYLLAMERLESAGYEQYEISNAARPGRASRHNLKYWTDGQWIGFGCGAHSTWEGVRWSNAADTRDYLARAEAGVDPMAVRRPLSDRIRAEEAIVMGLRLTRGIDLSAIEQRYGLAVWARYGEDLGIYLEAGLLDHGGGLLRLTRRGMLLANEVMSVFIEPYSTVK
jgi:oxygen-independent coproporphyrinogen III oxidase